MPRLKQSTLFTELMIILESEMVMLEDKPEESAEATLRSLWLLAAGHPVSVEQAHVLELPQLTEIEVDNLKENVERRLKGIPLTHLTNRQQFMGIDFLVGSEALIPRKETELLGYGALELLNKCTAKNGSAKVIDVCTGSGNLALAFAYHQSGVEVYAADLSVDAVELAKRNNTYMDLEDRVVFYTGDFLEPFEREEYYNKIDLLTCNPPYISSGKLESMPDEIIEFEPSLAFDGGPFGIKILTRLIKEAPKYLADEGWLAFELGLGQGEPIMKRLEKNKDYKALKALRNANGEIRAIMAQANH